MYNSQMSEARLKQIVELAPEERVALKDPVPILVSDSKGFVLKKTLL